MSSEDNGENIKKYKCSNQDCGQSFTTASNRNRHEKRFDHTPPPRRSSIQKPIFKEETSKYHCPSPNCTTSSKFKGNVQRHIVEGCAILRRKKEEKGKNKVCPHCDMTFTQKSNRDRHVKRVHSNEVLEPVLSICTASQSVDTVEPMPTFDNNTANAMNVSFFANDGTVFEQSLTLVDEETPIFEVFEPLLNSSFVGEQSEQAQFFPMCTGDDDELQILEPPPVEIIPSLDEHFEINSPGDGPTVNSVDDRSDSSTSDEPIDFVQELKDRARKREFDHEALFKNKVLNKIKQDIHSRSFKHSAGNFLYEAFGDALSDDDFLRWLGKKLDIRPGRLRNIVENCHAEHRPRNSLSVDVHQKIHDFWLKEENSITSNDRRNGRDVVRMSKSRYMSEYKNFIDSNIEEYDTVFRKTNTTKRYVKAPRMIYTKSMFRLHKDFQKTYPGVKCSQSTFIKYKPFYIEVPTEREKQSCLCIKCQNAHLQLRGINTFQKQEKLPLVHSVTEYLKLQETLTDDDLKSYPERSSSKIVNYYVFESVVESFVKEGETKTYTRTTRVDKSEQVRELYETLISSGPHYLHHRSHVDNIKSTLPLLREHFSGKYVEMDFSENIALKPKNEVQSAHFSGKQYALHCSIVINEDNERSYVYHLSDDTGHDALFVDEVLEDIFQRWKIRDETIMIKSDNAPTQYKNKYAFSSYQNLANKYNVRIIRLYGAAGHGKGLIDAMSSFGVKSILKRDIVTWDAWYANSEKMCDHLRKNPRSDEKIMDYQTVDPVAVDSKRMSKKELIVPGCMSKHLFDYKPKSKTILTKEYLCDCQECLQLNFEKCSKITKTDPIPDSDGNDCDLDNDEIDENTKIYEFVTIPSYVALISEDTNEPVYIMKVEKKGKAEKEEKDEHGHVVSVGQLYLQGKYLKQEKSRSRHLKRFSIYPGDVICEPREVFDVFVDIADDLTMTKESFEALLSNAM